MSEDTARCLTLGCDKTPTDNGLCQECRDAVPTPPETPDAPAKDTPKPEERPPTDVTLDAAPSVETGVSPEMGFDSWMPWSDWDRKQPNAKGYSVTENPLSYSTPGNWTDFDTARRWGNMDPRLAGHGFVLQREDDAYAETADPYYVIDFDDSRDPDTGRMHPAAIEIIERAGSYGDVSTSWTGGHIIAIGSLPDGVKSIDAELPHDGEFPDASIEVYDGKRFVAMTGRHIVGTPEEPREAQALIEELADEYATVPEAKPDAMVIEPAKTRDEIADVETTEDRQDVYDAIEHTRPHDIRLRSTVTEERSDGSKSLDPHWENSDSGARLAQIDDGWVYRKGMRGLDALQVVALEDRIIHSVDDYPSGEDFGKAVDALRERGAHIPEYEGDGDAEAVSALPLKQLDALSPQERRRAAKKRGIEWPNTSDARDRLFERVTGVMANKDSRVIDAPTSLGKSHTIAGTPWGDAQYDNVTDERPVVHLSKTRDAREEAVNTASRAGGCFVLLGRHEACPIAAGSHDPEACEGEDREPVTVDGTPASQWFDAQCDGKRMPFSVAHTRLKNEKDQDGDLPCCADGDRCRAIVQWEELREADPALIEATHNFAHVPGLRLFTNLVFDEEPDFAEGLDTDRVREMITALLKELDAPVTTWEAFIGLARMNGGSGDAGAEADQLGHLLETTEPDRDWYFEEPSAHTLALPIARAIYRGQDRGNGRRGATVAHDPPRLDANVSDDDSWNREWVRVVLDEDNEVQTVRCSPDLNLCRSVIGLDAHPAMPNWQVNTKPDIGKKTVLDSTERQLWRRYERGLRVVQVGDATRPYASGEYFNETGTAAVLEHLNDEYGRDFRTAITASSVEERTVELMREAGIQDPETMHYGEEKSRNDFADESIGLVNGSIDPGDDFVVNLLAELGLDAEPETDVNEDGEEYRVHGRGFVGEDAETAVEILASVRENHIAQSAGRYARDPDDPEATATVFVRTDAVPVGFADVQVPGVEWVYSAQQRRVVKNLRGREDPASAKEIARSTGVSKGHTQRTLKRLAEHSSVQQFEGEGDWGADLYIESGLPNTGTVSLNGKDGKGFSKRTTYDDSSTWSVSILDPTPTNTPPKASESSEKAAGGAWWLGGRSDSAVDGGGGPP